MDSLYTKKVKIYLETRKWPTGLIYEVVEYPGYLGLRLFRDNFNAFDGEDKLQIAKMVKECMENIRGDGIPIYMEVVAGDGRQG